MISVRDSLRLSEKINFQDIWLGKFVWAAHDFGYINLAKFPPKLTIFAIPCIISMLQPLIPPGMFAVLKCVYKVAWNDPSWSNMPKKEQIWTKFWPTNLHFFTLLLWKCIFCNAMGLTFCDQFFPSSWSNSGRHQIWDIFPSSRVACNFLAKNSQSGLFWGITTVFGPRQQTK